MFSVPPKQFPDDFDRIYNFNRLAIDSSVAIQRITHFNSALMKYNEQGHQNDSHDSHFFYASAVNKRKKKKLT
jgi:hypothetical protein